MDRSHTLGKRVGVSLALAFVGLLLGASSALSAEAAMMPRVSKPFAGPKVNGGTVSMTTQGGRIVLTLSDDFVDPKTPDPHWQVIDAKGNVYLLQKLSVKEGKFNKSIMLPAYVHDVARVQIWCAFAETNLGEAAFDMAASSR
jgi:hypothetical protein